MIQEAIIFIGNKFIKNWAKHVKYAMNKYLMPAEKEHVEKEKALFKIKTLIVQKIIQNEV